MLIVERNQKNSKSVAGAHVVIILLGYFCLFSFQQIVNASCISFEGQIGECVKFEECRSAVLLSQRGVNPGFCSFEDYTVCCTDYKNIASSENPSKYFQDTSTGFGTSNTNTKDTTENDSNIPKRKPGVSKSNGNSNHGKRKSNSDIIEEPYRFETPGTYYIDTEVTYRPVGRPVRPNPQEGNFLPPGQAKKKSWRDEKTTENDYSFERVTKKTPRGPNRKGSNKHTGGNQDPSNSRKWELSSERPEQGGKRLPDNSYSNQNEYESNYENKRTTPKYSNWGQGSYSSTTGPEYFGTGSENNYAGHGNTYSNPKPTQAPSNFNTNYPNYQGSSPQGSSFLGRPQGSRPGNKHPNYSQVSNSESNRPIPRPGSQKRKTISELKCEEYSKQVIKNITSLPLTTIPDPVTISVAKCITPQQLIVGGENTTIGEFPHMAAIGFRDRNKRQISWNCGGTLISELFVMTAGHCTSTSSGRPVKVRLGEYNLKKNDDGAYPVDYAVVQIITHPEYRPPSKYNDIALLKLSREVTFFKHIRPACLYSETTFSASKAIATGWGRMHYDGGTSEILQKVVLSIIDNQTCDRLYKVNVKTEVLSRGIVDSQICAGELTGGKDTCQGDSGGPLSITSATCIHHIIGITSFGKSCALPNSTGVYTRVSSYVPWIESVVWPNS